MKRFRSADAAVYAWHAAQSAAHAARGQAFGQSGRDYAPRCANRRCGRAGTRITTYPKGVPTVRCGACGTPWEYSEALVPAGVFRSGKGGRAPGRVELAASLEVVIESLYRTDDLELDRKILSDLAIHDEAAFTALVEKAKAALDEKHKQSA